jgi:hypothetical protein
MVHLSLQTALPPFVGWKRNPGVFPDGFAGSPKWFHGHGEAASSHDLRALAVRPNSVVTAGNQLGEKQ